MTTMDPKATPPIPDPQNGAERLAAWRAAGGVSGPPRTPIQRLADNPRSLRAAVTAKCFDCVGQDADPRWQWRVGNCDASCPLHAVRPHQRLAGTPTPVSLLDHPHARPTNPEEDPQ